MKKTLTLIAAAVLASAPVFADDSFVAPPYPTAETWSAYVFERNYEYTSTQVIIESKDMPDFVAPVELTSIGVRVQPQGSSVEPFPAKVYLAMTDRTSFTAKSADQLVPQEDLVLVWEGEFEFPKSDVTTDYTFQFSQPFEYEPGKNLVVYVCSQGEDGRPMTFISGTTTFNDAGERVYHMMYAYTNWTTYPEFSLYDFGPTPASRYISNFMPSFAFTYNMLAQPDVLDMAAVSMTVPTEPIQAGTEASFRVQLKNEGNVDVEECSVELLSIVDGQEPTVLATKTVEDYFAAGMTGNVNIKYTFDKGGDYKLAARVVYEGDTNADNNMTPEYAVVVENNDVCDFEVLTVTGPEKVTEGEVAKFTVGIKNVGTVAAAYAVQIDDATTYEILGANNPGTLLNPDETTDVDVDVTFEVSGEYQVIAQVISAFDENEDNDFSGPMTIVVEQQNGISEIAADFVNGAAAVTVADMNGRVVANSIDNLPAGIYVVTVKTADGKVKSAKFVVK